MRLTPGTSAAVTIVKPSQEMADPKSMLLMRPRGAGLRTVAPKSIPGRTKSSTYFARPVTFARPSRRGTERPMNGITPILLECLTGFYVAALESATEPADTLLGRTVPEPIGRHALARHPLDAIVANRRRRIQTFLEVASFELDLPERRAPGLRRLMRPDAGQTICLQLQTNGKR